MSGTQPPLPPVGQQPPPAPTASGDAAGREREVLRHRLTVLLVVTVWGWSVGPRLLQTLTAPKFRSSVGEQSGTNSAVAALSLTVLTVALLGLCALIVLATIQDPHPGRIPALLLMLAPWVYLVIRDAFVGGMPNRTALVYPAVVVALWMLRPRAAVLGTIGYLVALAALLSVTLGALLPSKGIFHFSSGDLVLDDKATLPMGILVGFLTHGNTLGTFLALGLPLVAAIPRRWLRRWAMALTLFALFWTASRSAFGTVAVAALFALVLRVLPPRQRRTVGPVLALVPFLLVVVLPLVVTNPRTFTNRGFIWAQSLEWWQTNVWFGLGSEWYDQLGRTTERIAATAFHGHNQFVQLAVTGGIVLLMLVGAQLVAVAVRAGRLAELGHPQALVFLVTLAGACALERSLTLVDNFGVFPVVALTLGVLMFADDQEAEREDVNAASPAAQPSLRYSTTRCP